MITTRRSSELNTNYGEKAGVDLLERKVPQSYEEYNGGYQEESVDEARERMQRNLDKLMNYDRFNEENMTSTVVEDNRENELSVSNDDCRPTSTTMQFTDGDIDQVYGDMKRGKVDDASKYHLNTKGKVAVFLYALAVTVILALIVLNTGVLTVLTNYNAESAKVLNEKISLYQSIEDSINLEMSDAVVQEIALNDFGMIEG